MREKGKGTRERGKRDICPRGTKYFLWIERQQMWPIGKWGSVKGKRKTPHWLAFIGHVNSGSQNWLFIAGLQYSCW